MARTERTPEPVEVEIDPKDKNGAPASLAIVSADGEVVIRLGNNPDNRAEMDRLVAIDGGTVVEFDDADGLTDRFPPDPGPFAIERGLLTYHPRREADRRRENQERLADLQRMKADLVAARDAEGGDWTESIARVDSALIKVRAELTKGAKP